MELQKTIDHAYSQLDLVKDSRAEALDFEWEGIRFHAQSSSSDDGRWEIHLRGKLGKLFFTIEDSFQRSLALEKVFSTNRGIDGTYTIDRDGNVIFNNITMTENQQIGGDLMSAMTLILLEAETHLRAMKAHLKPSS